MATQVLFWVQFPLKWPSNLRNIEIVPDHVEDVKVSWFPSRMSDLTYQRWMKLVSTTRALQADR